MSYTGISTFADLPMITTPATVSSASEDDEEPMESDQSLDSTKNMGLSNISFTVGESESDSDQEHSRKGSISVESIGIQTVESGVKEMKASTDTESTIVRSLDECVRIYSAEEEGARCLTDTEVITLVNAKKIPAYQLEKAVQDEERGVAIR